MGEYGHTPTELLRLATMAQIHAVLLMSYNSDDYEAMPSIFKASLEGGINYCEQVMREFGIDLQELTYVKKERSDEKAVSDQSRQ